MGPKWKWIVGLGLSAPSFSARPQVVLQIEAHGGRMKRKVCFHEGLCFIDSKSRETLVPEGGKLLKGSVAGEPFTSISWLLGDWVIYDNPVYVDCDCTLHATLEMTLASSR
ncbi:hypothetical protein EDD22DRAFT_230713 [Suillus occidentalis]|nr:hypothetical protein EDD22DRAFT_230713 [Suillus occidentalis]